MTIDAALGMRHALACVSTQPAAAGCSERRASGRAEQPICETGRMCLVGDGKCHEPDVTHRREESVRRNCGLGSTAAAAAPGGVIVGSAAIGDWLCDRLPGGADVIGMRQPDLRIWRHSEFGRHELRHVSVVSRLRADGERRAEAKLKRQYRQQGQNQDLAEDSHGAGNHTRRARWRPTGASPAPVPWRRPRPRPRRRPRPRPPGHA